MSFMIHRTKKKEKAVRMEVILQLFQDNRIIFYKHFKMLLLMMQFFSISQ